VSSKRLYELLALRPGATVDEIRTRYRALARRHHPDLNPDDERAAAKFRAIRSAYETLLVGLDAAPEPDEVVLLTARKRADSSDRIVRTIAETRARLTKSEQDLASRRNDVRDGEHKIEAARRRSDHQMVRHFERRVASDNDRIYGLLGEISALERELQGLESRPSTDRSPSPPRAIDDELEALKRARERKRTP
jgi:hypothetical protein